ncbi:MAG TPA: hypothetical protein V6D00_12945 [Pantanalinema sp.]
MAGNITKRGESRWQIKVFLGRDPETGKQKFHNKTIHGAKKDAQVYLNKVLRERDLGTWVEPSTLPFTTFLDRWLAEADGIMRLKALARDEGVNPSDLLRRLLEDGMDRLEAKKRIQVDPQEASITLGQIVDLLDRSGVADRILHRNTGT